MAATIPNVPRQHFFGRIVHRLTRRILHRIWYVHPGSLLTVQASPSECLRALAEAAKPSQQRLHLGNLFVDGRRYFLYPEQGGFRLTSNHKSWTRRQRSTIAAVLDGAFTPVSDKLTQIRLRAHIRPAYLIGGVFVPSFMTWLILSAPWPTWLQAALIGTLFGLSWIWHRLDAALQANEMMFFVHKALEDFQAEMPGLGTASTVVNGDMRRDEDELARDFEREWARFYEEHKED
ncbi:MAG: hypothetical protein H7175_15455 [Burkholderiales bacterium]|nr:hypothetical protein [Anaerolineae bacterium]